EAGKSQQVTEAEQAALLTEAFNLIKAHAGEYNIPTAIWYSYHDIPVNEWAYHCGLRKANGEYRPSWWAFEEATGAAKWPVEELQGPTGIGELKTNGDFYAKQGSLGAAWVGETSGIQSIAVASDPVHGPLIGALTTSGEFYVKQGSLEGAWTLEGTGVKAIAL